MSSSAAVVFQRTLKMSGACRLSETLILCKPGVQADLSKNESSSISSNSASAAAPFRADNTNHRNATAVVHDVTRQILEYVRRDPVDVVMITNNKKLLSEERSHPVGIGAIGWSGPYYVLDELDNQRVLSRLQSLPRKIGLFLLRTYVCT